MDHVIFRMGMLAVLRSKAKMATIGVMITASHNPEDDNGVKLVDPNGEMLENSWEGHATKLANSSDEQLVEALNAVVKDLGIDVLQPANVIYARDTRPSSHPLSEALKAGIEALGGSYIDYGILTTPQLHYLVRCTNSAGAYGKATETGYYEKLATAFIHLNSKNVDGCAVYRPQLWLDGANGVGALKMKQMLQHLQGLLSVNIFNDGSSGKLNDLCGADFVKVQQCVPLGAPKDSGLRCASFDGDGDRLVYFFSDHNECFHLLDGDKIATLMANYIGDLVRQAEVLSLKIGVVQTAYANGASTDYINNVAEVPVACVPTGVKHLHHRAQDFDVGVYFEANGHGTAIFTPAAVEKIQQAAKNENNSRSIQLAAERLLSTIDLINETVGDAISDLLVVETILRYYDWDVEKWNQTYTDLPSRQLKVKVNDRSLIQTTDAERRMTSPEGLQEEVDGIVAKFSQARSFVRPSGTEDAVRIYAEANTQPNADLLAYEVSEVVYRRAGGVGDRPKPPS